MKKKIELKTLEIIAVVYTLVECFISGKKNNLKVSVKFTRSCQKLLLHADLPGCDRDSLSELQRSLEFGCQVSFRWHLAISSLSLL